MTGIKKRGEEVRNFILDNLDKHPVDIASITSVHFKITRQAVNKHIQVLENNNIIKNKGSTRNSHYELIPLEIWRHDFSLDTFKDEETVWNKYISQRIEPLPYNVMQIWHYGFTEMFNNVIDHSSGTKATVSIVKRATDTILTIRDNGEGIFKKIQKALALDDERHSVLELAKGKFTTDPQRHSGEGIFFSSRMFDLFVISSGEVIFTHEYGDIEDYIFTNKPKNSGTAVYMKLKNNASRTSKEIFDAYSTGDDYGFTKTVIPVELAKYGSDELISRSQAKRLLARVERFKTIVLDFTGVDSIGQAFADEIFRVFVNQHPEIEIIETNSRLDVQKMINRARSHQE